MDIKKLQRVVVDALEDVKAQNIKVFNTVGLSDMFDRVVLASGTSNRQTRALAWRVAQQVKDAGGHVVSVEGADAGEWVLVDLGDLVVHVMQPAIRDYYGLEEIWGGKPVRVKIAEPAARRIAAHAAGDGVDTDHAAPPAAPAPAVKRAATSSERSAVKSTAKSPPRSATTSSAKRKAATKTATRRAANGAAKKAPAGRKPATRVKTSGASKSARRAAPRKAVARKPTPRKKAKA